MSILGIALPLLGFGGIGAALVFIPGLLPAVIAFAKSIPTKAWIAIAAIALLIGGYFVHQHMAHAANTAAYKRGSDDRDAAWQKRFDEMRAAAVRWKAKAETNQAAISKDVGAQNAQDLHDIGARADDQRLRGAGQATAPACGGHVDPAGLPATPGGHVAAGGSPDPRLAGLPPEGGLAIVPWRDLVSAGERDANRAEVIAWRAWYVRQAEFNRQLREAANPAAVPTKPR